MKTSFIVAFVKRKFKSAVGKRLKILRSLVAPSISLKKSKKINDVRA